MNSALSNNAPRPRIEDVRAVTCAYFGLTHKQIVGHCRARRMARPRQIAMAIAREECGASYPELGRAFGGRDHTTVIHAFRRINELCATDHELALHVERIRGHVYKLISPEGEARPAPGQSLATLKKIAAPYIAVCELFQALAEPKKQKPFELPIDAPIRAKLVRGRL